MGTPNRKQTFQDWITQKWVILFGNKIDAEEHKWLIGPFGSTNGIGLKFIQQLAKKEHLVIDKHKKDRGLIQSINQLKLSENELEALSQSVIDFYENTSNYDLDLKVKWNPFFKGFGFLIKIIFSNRIEQLNVPIQNSKGSKGLKSEIIHLLEPTKNEIKRTIWLRAYKTTGQVVYSGVYETCTIPSGETCIKAIFPLPNGNAIVILKPRVGINGELILESSGRRIGDSGFYFLLRDSKGQLWTKFIKSFKDKLVVSCENDEITAVQTLTLWNLRVLKFEYEIKKIQRNV
ncbi:hypothetical protein Aeqsu_0259 [Aequorivita sublithincola DSM 14238]|uniref:Uncharacterized protein n=1 Tax=Aequorivita sublithincola (strain DSM 14238 / LMG 21431 / ACAM 643 / 9-3) TaxID=746697 RepID=I3YS12_AEQSU|nr:hypothetical protein [Aequorivita sublithincola]AFL79780.1 hypothetical protein Aeqsu_0259 [Aequorivita sublithincola DSM 14238]